MRKNYIVSSSEKDDFIKIDFNQKQDQKLKNK